MYVKDSLRSSQEPANVQYVDVLCVQEPSLLRHYTLSIINSCRLLEWSQCVHLRGQLGQELTAGLCFQSLVTIYQLTVSTIPEQHRFEKLSNFASDILW